MTLQVPLHGALSTLGFGVNEISSAISIGRWAGSFLTVQSDGQIFPALEQEFKIFFRSLPDHLRAVHLDRRGTVLGSGQRRIPHRSMLPNVELDSIKGITTFLILILRYVETPEDIIEHLHSLLRGDFAAVCGGKLESGDHGGSRRSLPYTIRNNLRTYVKAVLDADADSEEHTTCLQWFGELSHHIAHTHKAFASSRLSQADHRRFLKHLLSDSPANHFHTLSMGTAMIALTAMANGANISLQCIINTKERIIVPEHRSRATGAAPISVTLWLTEPPQDVAQALHVVGPLEVKSRAVSSLTVMHGGDAEISRLVAQHLPGEHEAETCLGLWQEGIRQGRQATWEVVQLPFGQTTRTDLRLSSDFVQTESSALVAPLVKFWYTGPRTDRRHSLAWKAANAFHVVHGYTNYRSGIQADVARQSMNLFVIAFAIGCLRSLISSSSVSLSAYALVLEEPDGPGTATRGLIEFCIRLFEGVDIFELLCTAGSIWGGLPQRFGFPDARLVGIVCPEVTILLDVLDKPKQIAKYGLTKGLMSIHTGSVPILPRDPKYGAIVAGDPNSDEVYAMIGASKKETLQRETSEVIFTLEPFAHASSPLSAVLCGWESGDVAFELDPFKVLQNLLEARSLPKPSSDPVSVNDRQKFVRIRRDELSQLQNFRLDGVIGVIDVGSSLDWQIVAAGCVMPKDAIMVVDEGECNFLRGYISSEIIRPVIIRSELCLILCQSQRGQ